MNEYVGMPIAATIFPIVVKKTEGRDTVVSFKRTKKATTTDDYCDFRGFYNPFESKSMYLLLQAFDDVCGVVKSLNLSEGDVISVIATLEAYTKKINCGINNGEPIFANVPEYSWRIQSITLVERSKNVNKQDFSGKYEKLSKERLYSNNAPINFA